MDNNSIHVTSSGTVLYNTDTPIAGFQFNLDGANILSAAGGNSEAAGFMISASATTVLGFSLDGSTIDGCGTMIELELDGDASGLSGIIISDAGGVEIAFSYFEGGGDGEPCCGDGECNGDETAESCPEDCGGDDCEEAWDGDACSMDNNSVHVTSSGTVLYNTDTPIAGFQFNLDGANILSASGGNSDAAGFMISAN